MPIQMPRFSGADIMGNLIFSGLGYIFYSYGKKTDNMKVMIQGGVLMGYSYFVPDTFWMYAVGTALTAWVWTTRDR